jgi:hypothetical protein
MPVNDFLACKYKAVKQVIKPYYLDRCSEEDSAIQLDPVLYQNKGLVYSLFDCVLT